MILRRTYVLLTAMLLCVFAMKAQYFRSERSKLFKFTSDTIKLDSLSIVKNSINIRYYPAADSLHAPQVNYTLHALIFKGKRPDSIFVSYKVFPYDFERKLFHKDASLLFTDLSAVDRPFTIKYNDEKNNQNLLKNDGLNKNGNKQRHIGR